MFSYDNFLFEISSEVCNKVGGIYTVIKSKLDVASNRFKNYYLIGMYKQGKNEGFVEGEVPGRFLDLYHDLLNDGIKLYFGYWDVKGRPLVVLVDYMNWSYKINDVKTKLWEEYKIDSLGSDWYDYDSIMLWSYVVGVVIERLSFAVSGDVFVHSHEWMSGGAILYLKILNDSSRFKCVFTTHATLVGRVLASQGRSVFDVDDIEKEVYKLGIATKHQTERALAHVSDCFTTVSDVTAKETLKCYGKKVDVVLYNGFEKVEFENNMFEQYREVRARVIDYLKGFFYDFYEEDFDSKRFVFISGRNEFRNKGIDVFLEVLGRVNQMDEFDGREVVAFVLIPVGDYPYNNDVLKSLRNYKQGGDRVEYDCAMISTNDVPFNNDIIKACLSNSLVNKKDDRVKVVFVPFYLDYRDDIFPFEYYELISGLDFGVFPSLYEPWGYTPLEVISYGCVGLTVDLAGFGKYSKKLIGTKKKFSGLEILNRDGVNDEKFVDDLFEKMVEFLKLSDEELNDKKGEALAFSENFLWSKLYGNYIKAYKIASKK